METLDDKLANAVPIITMTKYSHKINVTEEAVSEELQEAVYKNCIESCFCVHSSCQSCYG